MIKKVTIAMLNEEHYTFKNKVIFYDLTLNEVCLRLIEEFTTTTNLDHLFNIPQD